MKGQMRASVGQSMLVCIDTIKADKREEFRRYLYEVKAPAVRAANPAAHASVRLLEPTSPNPDGTWTFIWLMDPAVEGEDYEMEPMYEAYYGRDKVDEYMRQWDDCHVFEQVYYEVRQTDW